LDPSDQTNNRCCKLATKAQGSLFILQPTTTYKSMMKRSTALAVASLLVLISESHAAATILPEDDNNHHLRRRPIGVTLNDHEGKLADDMNSAPSSFFGSVLRNLLNTSENQRDEDLDSHYPLFLTKNERSEDDYDINDVLLSFTIRKPKSDIMRQPPGRKLAEAAHADATHADATHADATHADATHAEDATHGEEEGDHGDAHDMVVHVTYENIYAILVFLFTATALGIVTSKLGMVSATFEC